jgi:hypothetical protein
LFITDLLDTNVKRKSLIKISSADMGGGGENMTAEEKERLAQLEQERLEALRYSFDLILIKHQSLGSQ